MRKLMLIALAFAPGCAFIASALGPPSTEALNFEVKMVSADVPRDALCLNTETKGPRAMELIHPLEALIVIQGGERPMSPAAWAAYEPPFPWVKNQEIQNLYESHCHYRSPGATSACRGWACARYEEVSGHTWRRLGRLRALGCIPKRKGRCERVQASPGSLAVILVEKCHVIRVKPPTMELVDPRGNRFVMNAHAGNAPNLEVELPEGWRFEVVERDGPLEVKPFGGGDACFHVVLNDSAQQFYHQVIDTDGVFP